MPMYTTMTIPGIIPELEEIVYKEELSHHHHHSNAAARLWRASYQAGQAGQGKPIEH